MDNMKTLRLCQKLLITEDYPLACFVCFALFLKKISIVI